jgi:hypothetical protein
MSRVFTIELYDTHNNIISTLTADGDAGDTINKFFCTNGTAKRYVVKNEMGTIVSEQDIRNVLPSATQSTSQPNLITTWKNLDVCCNTDWLLTEDTENVITDQDQDPVILSN